MNNIPNFAKVGKNSLIDSSVVFGPNCKNIEIGHGVTLRRDIFIDVENLKIADYTTIHHGTVLHGSQIVIGYNCWIGHYSILDGHGGLLSIGNNVGIGAQSQLWSHIKFGDVMAGCRFNAMGALVIHDDAWIVGHGIVSPITVGEKAMLMVGGVATKNLKPNHVYGGTPAVDLTDKIGNQFDEPTPKEMTDRFLSLIDEYASAGNGVDFIKISNDLSTLEDNSASYFNPPARTYRPTYSDHETKFIKFLLYDRAKFVPYREVNTPS